MKEYNLNELHIERDQQGDAHLCICDFYMKEKGFLYPEKEMSCKPIGWYRYIDVFNGDIVSLGYFYNKVGAKKFLTQIGSSHFSSELEQEQFVSFESVCTIDEVETLWNSLQEKKGRGYQKTIGIKK